MKNNKIGGNLFDIKILSRLFIFCKPFINTFYVLIFLTLLLSVLGPIRPYLTQIIIDDYVLLNDLEGLKGMTLLLFFLLIINAIIMYFHTYLSGWLGQNIIKNIRVKLFSHMQSFKLKFFDKTPIGRVVTRNVSDIETIADIFGQGVAAIIGDILLLFGIVSLMFLLNWKLTLISLSTLPLLLLTTYVFKEKVKVSFNEVRDAVANLNSYVDSSYSRSVENCKTACEATGGCLGIQFGSSVTPFKIFSLKMCNLVDLCRHGNFQGMSCDGDSTK